MELHFLFNLFNFISFFCFFFFFYFIQFISCVSVLLFCAVRVWDVKYNRFHDQLLLSCGTDGAVTNSKFNHIYM